MITIPSDIVADHRLNPGAKLVYGILHSNRELQSESVCLPTAFIAGQVGLCQSMAALHLRALKRVGVITLIGVRPSGGSNGIGRGKGKYVYKLNYV